MPARVQLDRRAIESLAKADGVQKFLHRKGKSAAGAAAGRAPVRTGDFKSAGFSVSTKVRRTRDGEYVTTRVFAKDKDANVIVLGSKKSNRKRHKVFNLGDFGG